MDLNRPPNRCGRVVKARTRLSLLLDTDVSAGVDPSHHSSYGVVGVAGDDQLTRLAKALRMVFERRRGVEVLTRSQSVVASQIRAAGKPLGARRRRKANAHEPVNPRRDRGDLNKRFRASDRAFWQVASPKVIRQVSNTLRYVQRRVAIGCYCERRPIFAVLSQ